jgi:hypothetical protein
LRLSPHTATTNCCIAQIVVRDLASGTIKQQLKGHETTFIMDLAIDSNSELLATAGVDNQIILAVGMGETADWIDQNRALSTLPCESRADFRLPLCDH